MYRTCTLCRAGSVQRVREDVCARAASGAPQRVCVLHGLGVAGGSAHRLLPAQGLGRYQLLPRPRPLGPVDAPRGHRYVSNSPVLSLSLLLLLHAIPAKRGKVPPADKLQVNAVKCLPLVRLARSKQDPINRGHGAQYLYRPPPAGYCL